MFLFDAVPQKSEARTQGSGGATPQKLCWVGHMQCIELRAMYVRHDPDLAPNNSGMAPPLNTTLATCRILVRLILHVRKLLSNLTEISVGLKVNVKLMA